MERAERLIPCSWTKGRRRIRGRGYRSIRTTGALRLSGLSNEGVIAARLTGEAMSQQIPGGVDGT